MITAAAAALWLLVCAPAAAATQERGYPMITVHPPEVHKGGPQTFEVAQDSRGILYFGGLAGLVAYDGAWWRMIKLPDEQAVNALATDARGRVAVGADQELGHLAPNADGEMQYVSLMNLIPKSTAGLGSIRDICSAGDGFLFVASQRLLFWDGRTIRSSAAMERTRSPRRCLVSGSTPYVTGPTGLQRVDLATLSTTIVGPPRDVQHASDLGGGRTMVIVRNTGIFLQHGGTETAFASEAAAWVKGKAITGSARLADGRVVIITRQDGLMILSPEGAVEQIIHEAAGLPDAVLNDVLVDREGALWLAMEGPVVRIDIASPVSLFDQRRGVNGSVGDVMRHEGRIYTAGSHGLFVFDEHGRATRVEGFNSATWRLLSVGGELLVTTSQGLYRMRGHGKPELISPADWETYDIIQSSSDPARVWLATNGGLASMRREGDGWTAGPLHQQHDGLTSVVEHRGIVWCGTVFNGVVRFENATATDPVVRQYGSGEMAVAVVAGRVVVIDAVKGRVLAINAAGALVPDPLLGHIQARDGFFGLAEDSRGDVWINSTPPQVHRRDERGHYAADGIPLVSVTASDIQSLRADAGGVMWFGSDKGLFRYEPSRAPRAAIQPAPRIRRVIAGENKLLYGGATSPRQTELTYDLRRRMRIEFAPVSYHPGIEYQYRLEPVDRGWSHWTREPFIDYTNLEAANYVFHLRARGAAAVSRSASWSFTVLPPWYRTIPATIAWLLLAAIAIALLIMTRTRGLRKQAERLRARVAEQTVELRHKNELLEQANERLENLSMLDDLTGIANRRYFDQALADEWNRAIRREEPLSLILIDLDHFKELNDRRGHRAGDDCLRAVGRFLGQTLRRSGEVVARYGGEEFAVLLPTTDAESAAVAAERLREGIEALDFRYDENEPRCVTTSCGVATLIPTLGDATHTLIDLADGALYAAKDAGRNRVSTADENPPASWLTM